MQQQQLQQQQQRQTKHIEIAIKCQQRSKQVEKRIERHCK